MPELRRDPVTGTWVIIATERAQRPSDFRRTPEPVERREPCVFCEGNEDQTPPEILSYRRPGSPADKPGWWVRVVPDKRPLLRIEGDLNRQGIGMFDMMNGVGAHEIIIESPTHVTNIAQLGDNQIEKIFWAYRDRILDLERDRRFRHILIFKNQGPGSGATIEHVHSNLIATPIVPKRVDEELNGARGYYDYKERCVYCDIIKEEESSDLRVVLEDEKIICFEPFASRFPFETWIAPKRHSADFTNMGKEEVMSLSVILKVAIAKLSKALSNPPYNYIIHTAPFDKRTADYYHWHMEIMPRLTRVAGFEWGSGFYINPTPPEEAAKYLREVEV